MWHPRWWSWFERPVKHSTVAGGPLTSTRLSYVKIPGKDGALNLSVPSSMHRPGMLESSWFRGEDSGEWSRVGSSGRRYRLRSRRGI